MKNYKDRPKYKKLLLHPFVLKYEREEVDVGAWYRSHLKNFNNSLTTTPNNNQVISLMCQYNGHALWVDTEDYDYFSKTESQ